MVSETTRICVSLAFSGPSTTINTSLRSRATSSSITETTKMVEQISLVHMPSELAVYAAFYRDLQNAKFLREQLLAGNSDFEYAFIDASMVGPSSAADHHVAESW